MWTLGFIGAALVVGFVAGLLVGRKNPKIADAAATAANAAKAGATTVADAAKAAAPKT